MGVYWSEQTERLRGASPSSPWTNADGVFFAMFCRRVSSHRKRSAGT